MTANINYRRQLLRAVDLFLEQTPTASARARSIIKKCDKPIKSLTLDGLRWRSIVMELGDTVYTTDVEYLANLRQQLASGSMETERIYLNHDLREDFSAQERRWFEQLQRVLTLLRAFPHLDHDSAVSQYQSMVAEVRRAESEMPSVREGDETLVQRILAEVTIIVAHIDLRYSLGISHYLAACAPLRYIYERSDDEKPTLPDATDTVLWAQKTLDALAGKARLLIIVETHKAVTRVAFL